MASLNALHHALTGHRADRYVPDHGSTDFKVRRYELELDIRLGANLLRGRALIMAQAQEPLTGIWLDLTGLGLDKATINGARVVKHVHRQGRLHLTLPIPVAAGEDFTVELRYSGNPSPAVGMWGEVGWEELDDGVLVAGQPTGAPTWFPCNDRPDDKASYGFTVTTDAGYTVVCNGVLTSHTRRSSREIWVYEQSAPMASYLATVQIGRYKIHPLPAAKGTSQLPVLVAVPKKLQASAAQALSRQREMLDVFTERFGPYPFPSYTVVVTEDELEIPLEAQSLSIFGRNHLETSWPAQRLIAHELSHQWFGNSLTLGSWQDIWLHEGFACFAEWVWSQDSGSMTIDERAAAAHQLLSDLPQDLAVGDPGAEDMFDDRVYKRGALALEALRQETGDELFFNVLRTWVANNQHSTVATKQFFALADQLCAGIDGFSAERTLSPWLFEKALPPLSGESPA